jgi:hypothetical protein
VVSEYFTKHYQGWHHTWHTNVLPPLIHPETTAQAVPKKGQLIIIQVISISRLRHISYGRVAHDKQQIIHLSSLKAQLVNLSCKNDLFAHINTSFVSLTIIFREKDETCYQIHHHIPEVITML